MAVGAAVVYAYTHFKTFRTIVNDVGKFLAGAFKTAWKLAGDVVHWFATTVLPVVKRAIQDVIKWFESHKQDFVRAWDSLVKDVHKVILWFYANVITWIKYMIFEVETWWKAHSQQIAEVWQVVWSSITTAVKVAWDGTIKPTITLIVFFWKNAWDTIRDVFKLVWNVIKDVLTTVLHNILNTLGIVLDLMTGKWGKAWQDAKKLVSQGLHDIVQLIVDLTSGFGNLLYDAGANIIKGLVSGIKSMFGSVGGVMSDITGFIKGFLPNSPAKWGPLSGDGDPTLRGRNISRMLAEGITDGTPHVGAAMTKLTGGVSGALAVGGGSYGSLGALAIGGAGALGGSPLVINVTVQGSVISQRKLMDEIQTYFLRYGRRNPTTGLTY
jgi:phage-related protein